MKLELQEQVFDQYLRLIAERPYAFERLFVEGQVIEIEGKKATVTSCSRSQSLLVITKVSMAECDVLPDLRVKKRESRLNDLIQTLAAWWVLLSIGIAHYVIQFTIKGPFVFAYMGTMLLVALGLLLLITIVLLWEPMSIGWKMADVICRPVKCALRFVFGIPEKVAKLKKWSQDV
jgi:hypothetical protein